MERALGRTFGDEGTYIEGCMSRKEQVVPPLEQTFVAATVAKSSLRV